MIEATRLLGFSFASADLLFEVDREGRILFALGATSGFAKGAPLIGRPGADLFKDGEGARFKIIVQGLAPGDRVGPLPMTLACGTKGSLCLCYLPLNKDRISCTLVRPGKRGSLSGGTDAQTGLADREAFVTAALTSAGTTAGLALVNVPELSNVCAGLAPAEAQSLLRRIGDSVKSMGAAAAGRLSKTGFGVVVDDPRAAKGLADRIGNAIREGDLDPLEIKQVLVSLRGRGLTAEQTMLALRHVVGRFAESTLKPPAPGDLADAFDAMVGETFERAQAFNTTVSDGAFDLVFEPIVDLKTSTTSHYEALTRFAQGQSPSDTIRFAEELGIAESLDLAVAVKVFSFIERGLNYGATIAMNVSGRSIATPASFAMLAGLLNKKRALAKQVLIEVTESSEMPDLGEADKAIQTIRKLGFRVGIDDFGAGAASLQYLHGLSVDFVKVDGGLVQRLGKSPREDALLKGVVSTCADLKSKTIAEWIDSPDRLKRCADLGFDLGQGRFFGEPLSELPNPAAAANRNLRRAGTKETWG
jgi:EAL domain-containing protein (putative c-di-GMP-specific phosphodiesterase class I)